METNKSPLGAYLKSLREKRDMSQEALCAAVGKGDPSCARNAEGAARNVRLSTLEEVYRVGLGLSQDEWLFVMIYWALDKGQNKFSFEDARRALSTEAAEPRFHRDLEAELGKISPQQQAMLAKALNGNAKATMAMVATILALLS